MYVRVLGKYRGGGVRCGSTNSFGVGTRFATCGYNAFWLVFLITWLKLDEPLAQQVKIEHRVS